MIDAVKQFRYELTRRGLLTRIPTELYLGLVKTLTADPTKAIVMLANRLRRGSAVIDQQGGDQAPEHLWLRFEAVLCAKQAADAAVASLPLPTVKGEVPEGQPKLVFTKPSTENRDTNKENKEHGYAFPDRDE